MTSLVSQLLIERLTKEDDECFTQLFVALHKSNLLSADVFIKVCFLLVNGGLVLSLCTCTSTSTFYFVR